MRRKNGAIVQDINRRGGCGMRRSVRGGLCQGSDACMAHHNDHEHEQERGLALETARPELARPPLYQVVLINDDFTPMDFVVEVLRGFFGMDQEKAVQVMLHVHTRGKGVCGVYTRELAETKVAQVNEYSRAHQHPLLCTMEKL